MNTPLQVVVSRIFAFSPAEVFDAWLDPVNAGKWLFATPEGAMEKVTIDARIGGRFEIVERRDGEDAYHSGEYLEIDRPRHLVFMFAPNKEMSDPVRVEINIVPRENGCELTLTQEVPPEFAQYLERGREGWTSILEGLNKLLERKN